MALSHHPGRTIVRSPSAGWHTSAQQGLGLQRPPSSAAAAGASCSSGAAGAWGGAATGGQCQGVAAALPAASTPAWSWGSQCQHHHLRRAASSVVRALSIRVLNTQGGGFKDDKDDDFAPEIPTKFELSQRPDKQKPLIKVRLSVHYRVHSRQMLCIGGSQIPFGWSFLSIAKVPMTWNSGDIWQCEVELQAGQRIEYKYVILEEQDWTKLENEDAQGLVEITYRQGSDPGRPPDVQVIQKQMAIVAWQPGPNRVLQVPSESELEQLKPGDVLERIPPRPNQRIPYETTGKVKSPPPLKADPFEGTWEVLTMDDEGRPFLDRHDVWGWVPNTGGRPSSIRGFSFGS